MGFLVIPAVDLQAGRCVRLVRGDFARPTVFDDDPVRAALRWQAEGAPWLHVVDLDGAASGEPRNADAVASIVQACRVPVQVSGGIRGPRQIERLFELGVRRVVLGTLAVEAPDLVGEACARWGERIALGLDARAGRVATRGWLQTTDLEALRFAQRMVARGIRRIVATDIERDGTLTSPNFEALRTLVQAAGVPVIASGGVATAEHIRRLRGLGAEGAIVGRALYDGRLRYADAAGAAAPALGSGAAPC